MSRGRDDDQFDAPDDRDRPGRHSRGDGDAPPKKSNTTMIVLLIVGGLLVLVCGGCGIGGYFALQGVQKAAEKVKRSNDLKQIGLAYHEYNSRFQKAPEKAEDLQPLLTQDPQVFDLLKNGSVVFIYGVSLKDLNKVGHSQTVIAYEKEAPEKGGIVLYADAFTESVTAAEFATKRKASKLEN